MTPDKIQEELEKEIEKCKECMIVKTHNSKYPICNYHQGKLSQHLATRDAIFKDDELINNWIEQKVNETKQSMIKLIDERIRIIKGFKERDITLKAGELKRLRINDLEELKGELK